MYKNCAYSLQGRFECKLEEKFDIIDEKEKKHNKLVGKELGGAAYKLTKRFILIPLLKDPEGLQAFFKMFYEDKQVMAAAENPLANVMNKIDYQLNELNSIIKDGIEPIELKNIEKEASGELDEIVGRGKIANAKIQAAMKKAELSADELKLAQEGLEDLSKEISSSTSIGEKIAENLGKATGKVLGAVCIGTQLYTDIADAVNGYKVANCTGDNCDFDYGAFAQDSVDTIAASTTLAGLFAGFFDLTLPAFIPFIGSFIWNVELGLFLEKLLFDIFSPYAKYFVHFYTWPYSDPEYSDMADYGGSFFNDEASANMQSDYEYRYYRIKDIVENKREYIQKYNLENNNINPIKKLLIDYNQSDTNPESFLCKKKDMYGYTCIDSPPQVAKKRLPPMLLHDMKVWLDKYDNYYHFRTKRIENIKYKINYNYEKFSKYVMFFMSLLDKDYDSLHDYLFEEKYSTNNSRNSHNRFNTFETFNKNQYFLYKLIIDNKDNDFKLCLNNIDYNDKELLENFYKSNKENIGSYFKNIPNLYFTKYYYKFKEFFSNKSSCFTKEQLRVYNDFMSFFAIDEIKNKYNFTTEQYSEFLEDLNNSFKFNQISLNCSNNVRPVSDKRIHYYTMHVDTEGLGSKRSIQRDNEPDRFRNIFNCNNKLNELFPNENIGLDYDYSKVDFNDHNYDNFKKNYEESKQSLNERINLLSIKDENYSSCLKPTDYNYKNNLYKARSMKNIISDESNLESCSNLPNIPDDQLYKLIMKL